MHFNLFKTKNTGDIAQLQMIFFKNQFVHRSQNKGCIRPHIDARYFLSIDVDLYSRMLIEQNISIT